MKRIWMWLKNLCDNLRCPYCHTAFPSHKHLEMCYTQYTIVMRKRANELNEKLRLAAVEKSRQQ